MKHPTFAFFAGGLLTVLFGCTSAPEVTTPAPNPLEPVSAVHNRSLPNPPTGTFTVTYIPALFTEPDDVRKARHRNIATMIIMSLEQAGLRYSVESPDYEVSYNYRSNLGLSGGGYYHTFEISINKAKERTGDFGTNLVWDGKTWVDRWPDRDITYLFSQFTDALLANFPEGPRK